MPNDPTELTESTTSNSASFRLTACLGAVVSCLAVGGSIVLSLTPMPFYVAYCAGKILLVCSWAGLLISTLAIWFGDRANLRFKDAQLHYAVAWIGFGIPMFAFAYHYILHGRFFVDW